MFETPSSRRGQGALSQRWNLVSPVTIVSRALSAQSVPNNVFWTIATWDSVIRDDVGGFSLAKPSDLIVPAWARFCRISAYVIWENTTGGACDCLIATDLTLDQTGNNPDSEEDWLHVNEGGHLVTTGWIPTTGGIRYELLMFQNAGAARNFSPPGVLAGPAWMMGEWAAY